MDFKNVVFNILKEQIEIKPQLRGKRQAKI